MTSFPAVGPVATLTPSRPTSRGDDYAAPIQLFGASGSVTVNFWGAGPQANEPDVIPNDVHSDASVWLNFIGDVPGTLHLSSTESLHVEVGSGEDMESWTVQLDGDPSLGMDAVLGSNSPALIRVRPRTPALLVESATLDWTYVELIPPLEVRVLNDLVQSPGTFRISIGNGDPDATVSITDTWSDDLGDFDLDDEGTALSLSIYIPDAHDAGTYQLTVSHPGRDDVTVDFIIDIDALLDPIGQPADTTPVAVDPVSGVQKWVFQDPAPGGEQYVFEINPDSATSPHGDNVFTDDVTIAPDGQHLTWEGARRAVQWSFKGTLLTQTQYEALARFAGLNRRIYLIDNRSRAWVVVVDAFDPTFKQTQDYPWFHTYQVNVTIFAGPLTPVGVG